MPNEKATLMIDQLQAQLEAYARGFFAGYAGRPYDPMLARAEVRGFKVTDYSEGYEAGQREKRLDTPHISAPTGWGVIEA
jgi:hypothetical protein